MVDFFPSMLQKKCIHQAFFWCLFITLVWWSEIKRINLIISISVLISFNPSPYMKKKIENTEISSVADVIVVYSYVVY